MTGDPLKALTANFESPWFSYILAVHEYLLASFR